jgi:hypothetical protein
MTYGTTTLFLEYFGLRDLQQLPAADELRRIVVERPPTLVTAEAGLATVPPDLAGDAGASAAEPEAAATSPGEQTGRVELPSGDTDSPESNPQSSIRNLQSE